MKKIYALLISFSIFGLSAQTPFDALNLSQEQAGATARSAAMGGAFGAIGGDFSSISINPAGLGVYRSGEMSITPVISHNSTNSNYLNMSSDASRDHFGLGNVGFVFTSPFVRDKGLVSFNVGIGYNRLMNFNRETFIAGNGSPSSYLDYLASEANASGVSTADMVGNFDNANWSSVLGYEAYLVDYVTDGGIETYIPIFADGGVPVDQRKVISESGKVDEWLISMGGNISHKFYFGASMGLRSLDYKRESRYEEYFGSNADGVSYLQYNPSTDDYYAYNGGAFTHDDHLETSGYGVNFKAGFIFRPVDALRLGLSIHTPTYYSLSDDYSEEIEGDIYYVEGSGQEKLGTYSESPLGSYDYKLNTGLKMTASAAYFIGKRGMVSVDYELSDKAGMQLLTQNGNSSTFLQENSDINSYYGTAHNVRIGGEFRLAPTFSLRGGYAYYADAYTDLGGENAFDKINATNAYALGFGYRDQNFFIDLAYVLSQTNASAQLYYFPVDTSDPDHLQNYDAAANVKSSDNKLMFTVGFKF